jgi:two-component system, NtrC family, sensor kinase
MDDRADVESNKDRGDLSAARLSVELAEARQQQGATASVLKVMSASVGDLQEIFRSVVENSGMLCAADRAMIFRFDGQVLRLAAAFNAPAEVIDWIERNPIRPGDYSVAARSALNKRTCHVTDVLADPQHTYQAKNIEDFRTVLGVPILVGDRLLGVLLLYRTRIKPFEARQISLVETFADQAAIAIENARLFKDLQQRTDDLDESLQQQTATADVLKVISCSLGELEPVFQAMLANAVRLCGAKFSMLFLYENNEFRGVGKWNLPPRYSEFLGKNTIRADPVIPLGRVAVTKEPVQIPDVLVDQSYIERYPGMVAVAELGGARTLLQVPMLKENELVGSIGIYRQEVRPFTDKQIELVRSFAAQAVIAMENARLINELRHRTDELTRSLEDLRTAQDRLVQTEKLASLGQLTAGVAHEIKNPLNFVNNFSALSAELAGEINDVLADANLDNQTRDELDDLTKTLKSNLEKIVQHGKRADSIVKNMLLHSRQGSGEHCPIDINTIVDESLNLAYHGARAEKAAFNITMHRNFDPAVGMVDGYPQEITRVLLNLISNGFYAATKRQAEAGEGFEPTLTVMTRNLGDKVEIRIRDNGSGIRPEIMKDMFNPFFTTKPAGEGTGLGLSISHDIIVKQHDGMIDVDTSPDAFTEFRIVLPRAVASPIKSGDEG